MQAREMLNPKHPLHNVLLNWMSDRQGKIVTEPTLRSARKFLQERPQYATAKAA
jgi:hypothetical protein